MPPLGWKKPARYTGYQPSASLTNDPPPARGPPKKRQRRGDSIPALFGFDAALPTRGAIDEAVQNGSGEFVSQETMASIASEQRAETQVSLNVASDSDGDEQPALTNDSSSDLDDDEVSGINLNKNSREARKRRARKRRLDSPISAAPPAAAEFEESFKPATPTIDGAELLEISITLSKQKGHVPPVWAKLIYEWMKKTCVRGSVSLERGGKQQNLHCQIIIAKMMLPTDILALKNEIKALVGWKRGDGSGTYIQAHVFGVGQDGRESHTAPAYSTTPLSL